MIPKLEILSKFRKSRFNLGIRFFHTHILSSTITKAIQHCWQLKIQIGYTFSEFVMLQSKVPYFSSSTWSGTEKWKGKVSVGKNIPSNWLKFMHWNGMYLCKRSFSVELGCVVLQTRGGLLLCVHSKVSYRNHEFICILPVSLFYWTLILFDLYFK